MFERFTHDARAAVTAAQDEAHALRLLRRSGAPPVPVVAVTAFAMTEDRLRVERDGFDAYLEKPLRIRALPG